MVNKHNQTSKNSKQAWKEARQWANRQTNQTGMKEHGVRATITNVKVNKKATYAPKGKTVYMVSWKESKYRKSPKRRK